MLTAIPAMLGCTHAKGSVWTLWVEEILKQKDCGFSKAALVYKGSGALAAANKGFTITQQDSKNMQHVLLDAQNNNLTEKVTFQGNSYVIKAQTSGSFVAFNGNKYLIVSTSNRMMFVTVCNSRRRSSVAAAWLESLRQRLIRKDY